MNLWRLTTMNLHELLRRLRAGETRAAISRAMHISVNTVKDYRRWAEAHGLLEGPLLIGALVLGVWLFNRPHTADFIIDTENELKNKVTWPSRREEVNASLVVVVTVIIMLVFIFAIDSALIFGQKLLFQGAP